MANYGVYASTNSTGSGTGVYGEISTMTNTGYGGRFSSSTSTSGIGVSGESLNIAVQGLIIGGANNTKASYFNYADGGIVNSYGVYSTTNSRGVGVGVYGEVTGASNTGYGIQALNNSANGWGIYSSGSSPNYFAGNVGIGTTTPAAKLDVRGAIVSKTNHIFSGASVDLSLSNTHVLDSVGGSAITLTNMVDGGSYTLIIRDTTARTYTFTNCTNSFFRPANAATTVGTESIYGIIVVEGGGFWNCYINWQSGYQ